MSRLPANFIVGVSFNVFKLKVIIISLFVVIAFMNDFSDCLTHCRRVFALEDVASHVNASCSVRDSPVCHSQKRLSLVISCLLL